MRRRSSLQFLFTFLLLAPVALLSGCGVSIPKGAPQLSITLANGAPDVNSGAQTVGVAVTAKAPGPVPTGTMTYQVTDPTSQTITGPLNLPASTFTLNIAGSGYYVIQVQYSGDKSYSATTSTDTLLVEPAASSSPSAVRLFKGYPPIH